MSRRRRPRRGHRRERTRRNAVSAEDGRYTWIDYWGGRMFVVGSTEAGALYGHVEWTGLGAEAPASGEQGSIANEESYEPF